MAHARIVQRWPDGGEVEVDVHVDESYPDSVAEAVGEVLRLWRGAVPDDAAGQ